MERRKEKSPANAGRRIRWLATLIVLAGIVYTAGWFWLAGRIDSAAETALAEQREQGTTIDCADRRVDGYPFRFEVRCASVGLARISDGITVKARAFRSAAQVYEPSRIVAELDGPVEIESPGPTMTLNWDLAQVSAVIAEPLPKRASIAIDRPVAAIGAVGQAISAIHAEAHMRQAGKDLDLALRYDGLVVDGAVAGGRQLPALAGDADLSVSNGVALAASGVKTLRGVSGKIRRAALLVTPDQGVLVSGPFEVGPGGLLNATLELVIVDPAGLATAFKSGFPEYAAQIETLAAAAPRSEAGKTPEIKLPVTVRDGRASVGFIQLGMIPALD
jgi:hypothetical protein